MPDLRPVASPEATPNRDPLTGVIAVFGGVYNNHLALLATLEDARRRGARRSGRRVS